MLEGAEGSGLSKEQFGLTATESSGAICTTEQDCVAEGTGLSSSSHLHYLLQHLADANQLWGRLPPDPEMCCSEFSWLPQLQKASIKTQGYVPPAIAGDWTPAPLLDPVLLGAWYTCR